MPRTRTIMQCILLRGEIKSEHDTHIYSNEISTILNIDQ